MKEITFNLLSSCVCRDAFTLGDAVLLNHNIKVNRFVQSLHPLIAFSNPIPEFQNLTTDDLVYGSRWEKLCFMHAIKKTLFQDAWISDYLVIDMSQIGYPLVESSSTKNSFLTDGIWFNKNLEVFKKLFTNYESNQFAKTLPWNLPKEYIYDCVDKFIKNILSFYRPTQIIFVDIFNSLNFESKDKKSLYTFGNELFLNEKNKKIDEINEYTKSKLEGCHVIKFPKNVYCDSTHKWGVGPLHFTKNYYDYLLKAFDVICFNYDLDKEKNILETLKQKCELEYEQARLVIKLEAENKNLSNSLLQKNIQLKSLKQEADSNKKSLQNTQIQNFELKNSTNTKIKKLENDNKFLLSEINNIKKSKTYKIGEFITFLPKKIIKRRPNNEKTL